MCNFKWWHSIFWWGFQVLMVNSYLIYCLYCENNKIKAMSHYNYQKMIGHVWMEPGYYDKKPLPNCMKEQVRTTPESTVRTRGNFGGNNAGDSGASPRSISTASTWATMRSRMGKSLVNPYSGLLKCHMDHTIWHLPTKCRNVKDYCQLHYWCTGKHVT